MHECVAYLIRRIEVCGLAVVLFLFCFCFFFFVFFFAHWPFSQLLEKENSTVMGNEQLLQERRMLLREIAARLDRYLPWAPR